MKDLFLKKWNFATHFLLQGEVEQALSDKDSTEYESAEKPYFTLHEEKNMLRSALTILATALSLLVIDLVVPGVDLATFPAALIAAIALGLVNFGVKPLLSLLSLPLNFLTLGGFSLVVNGLCFWLASLFVPGFTVSGLPAIILGPVVLSFVNTFLSRYFAEKYPALASDVKGSARGAIDDAKGAIE